MQRRQLEEGGGDRGGRTKRSRLAAACHALAVRLGCAAREPHGGGVASDEQGLGKRSSRPTENPRLEGVRKGGKGGKGGGGEGGPDAPVLASELARAYQEVHGKPPHASATAPAEAPHAGGVGSVSPRYIPSTIMNEQVWTAKRHATHVPSHAAVPCQALHQASRAAGVGRPSRLLRADHRRRRGVRRRGVRRRGGWRRWRGGKRRRRADTIHQRLEPPAAAALTAAVAAHHAVTQQRRGARRSVAVAGRAEEQ